MVDQKQDSSDGNRPQKSTIQEGMVLKDKPAVTSVAMKTSNIHETHSNQACEKLAHKPFGELYKPASVEPSVTDETQPEMVKMKTDANTPDYEHRAERTQKPAGVQYVHQEVETVWRKERETPSNLETQVFSLEPEWKEHTPSRDSTRGIKQS